MKSLDRVRSAVVRRLPTRTSAARDAGSPKGPTTADLAQLARQQRRLAKRVDSLETKQATERIDLLEQEIQELRALGVRVAELTDLVTELIVREAGKQDPEYRQTVEKYLKGV